MAKKFYRRSARVGILLAGLTALGLAVATPASAHASDGYSHDSTIGATNTDWMAWLPNKALLSELSIPGTHDTGASRFGGDAALTQSMDLQEQLKSGIRAWDIRLKEESGRLKIYHGIARQGQDFDTEVLATASGFLDAHPNETVLMRIKDEADPATAGFDTLVKANLDKYSRVYRGTSNNPALRDIRGKIVVLQNFTSSTRFGIPWSSLTIQDQYNLGTNWDLANKWRAVKAHLDAAQNGSRTTTYVNFLSGSGGSFPYFVASGHSDPGTGSPNLLTGWTRGIINTCGGSSQCIPEYPDVNCFLGTCSVAFEGTNILTMNEINRRARPNRFGIIMSDFPGRGLIQAVIAANNYSGLLKGQESGRCVDVPGSSQVSGTALQLWDCGAGDGGQAWMPTPAGQVMVYGNKCLDVRWSGTTDGTPVQIWDCNGTGAQSWTYRTDGSLVNTGNGKCLTASNHGTTNTTPLVISTCVSGANQKWTRG
jgi:1-phosphatidylinositol phosphodiesterase